MKRATWVRLMNTLVRWQMRGAVRFLAFVVKNIYSYAINEKHAFMEAANVARVAAT